jgi:nucleotide-binding universal stress UspA family protein
VDQYIQGIETEVKVFYDKPFIDIIKEVIEFDRDLLIKAIEEPEKLSNVIFSSLDLKLLRKCPCPVWLIKPYEQKGDKQIIVALDYQPDNPENNILNTQMLNMAVSLALSEFYELHVVHAWKLDHEIFLRSVRIQNSKKVVDEMVEEEQEKRNKWLAKEIEISINSLGKTTSHYLDPQLHVIKGEAKNVIPELVKSLEAELIIMGTVGRSGISGYFIGNTAETILSKIDCSVLAIKPKDFVSPVKLN